MNLSLHNAKIVAGIVSRRVLTGPHSVQVSIVDACNYRCVMCWEHSSELDSWGADRLARDYHEQKAFKSTVMDFDLYRSFVASLRRTGTRQLGLAGIGEPLLHKRIVEAVAYAKGQGMSVWITTNGSMLNRELMRELVQAGLDDLSVSINAGARDEYRAVHTTGEEASFEAIIENLAWLDEYKRQNSLSLPRVSLSNVVCSLNSHQGQEMMETGVKAGASSVSYRPIDVFSQASKYALGEADLTRLRQAFPAAAATAREHGIATNIDSFSDLLALRESSSIPAPCFAGWLYPFVLANGDVTYCCVSREVVGNLNESSFEDIWYADRRRQLNKMALKIHKTQRPLPKSRCVGCEQMLANVKIYRRLRPLFGRPEKKTAPREPTASARS